VCVCNCTKVAVKHQSSLRLWQDRYIKLSDCDVLGVILNGIDDLYTLVTLEIRVPIQNYLP